MAKFNSSLDSLDEKFVGHQVDSTASNSVIGFHELKFLSAFIFTSWDGKLYLLPDSISDSSHLQCRPEN